jgi:hypothetical protein
VEEADELRLLRREYGLSAAQAWGDTPAWELDVLLGHEADDEPADDDVEIPEGALRMVEDPPVPEGMRGF